MQKFLFPFFLLPVFLAGLFIGIRAEKAHHSKNIYSIPCNRNESPADCQQRLGPYFEVIYTPKNNILRAELLTADISQYEEPAAY